MSYNKHLIDESVLQTVKAVLDLLEIPYEIKVIYVTRHPAQDEPITLKMLTHEKFVIIEKLVENCEPDVDDYIYSTFIQMRAIKLIKRPFEMNIHEYVDPDGKIEVKYKVDLKELL